MYKNRKSKKVERFIHPIHAKGLQSPSLLNAHVGKPLTDRKIEEYRRRGFYGTLEPFMNSTIRKIIQCDTLTVEQKEWKIRAYIRKKQ